MLKRKQSAMEQVKRSELSNEQQRALRKAVEHALVTRVPCMLAHHFYEDYQDIQPEVLVTAIKNIIGNEYDNVQKSLFPKSTPRIRLECYGQAASFGMDMRDFLQTNARPWRWSEADVDFACLLHYMTTHLKFREGVDVLHINAPKDREGYIGSVAELKPLLAHFARITKLDAVEVRLHVIKDALLQASLHSDIKYGHTPVNHLQYYKDMVAIDYA